MSQESPKPVPGSGANGTRSSSDESPSKETLLGFLDAELTLLSQQRINNGWTSWTLTGAIGALTWMLLGQWEAGWPTGRLWPLAYMTFALGFSYTSLIIQLLQARTAIPGSKTRFFLGSANPEKSKAGLAFNILQDALFLWLLFWCPTSSITWTWVGIWLSLALCMWLLLFTLSYTQFPIEVSTSTRTPSGHWLFLTHLLFITLLVIPVVLLIRDLIHSSPNGMDVKVGGLIAALHFLANHALDEGGRRPLIDNLLRVRRELALGGMSTQEAARHIEIEFLGMRVSDVFQEAARNFLARADALSKRCKSCISSLDAVLASLGGGTKLSGQQQLDLIKPLLDTCSRQASEIHNSLSQLNTEYKRIETKTRRFSSSTDAREAMTGILHELLSRYNATLANYVDIQAKLTQLNSVAKTIANPQASPPA